MTLRNTKTTYGWVSIILHWIAAIGVIWLYFLGEDIEHAADFPQEERRAIMEFHISIGMVFITFLAARVALHIAQRQPEKPPQAKPLNFLSYIVIWGFLGMITVLIVTGPIIEWSVLRPLEIFDLASIPSPFTEKNSALHKKAEDIHALASNLFWPLIILHVAGALKHLIIDRDGSFQRMLWSKKG